MQTQELKEIIQELPDYLRVVKVRFWPSLDGVEVDVENADGWIKTITLPVSK